jgi:hypothetical protein
MCCVHVTAWFQLTQGFGLPTLRHSKNWVWRCTTENLVTSYTAGHHHRGVHVLFFFLSLFFSCLFLSFSVYCFLSFLPIPPFNLLLFFPICFFSYFLRSFAIVLFPFIRSFLLCVVATIILCFLPSCILLSLCSFIFLSLFPSFYFLLFRSFILSFPSCSSFCFLLYYSRASQTLKAYSFLINSPATKSVYWNFMTTC